MKGQIYIDYMGGALLFFLSIVFVVTSALGTIPQFSEGIGQNNLEVTGWSLSTQLVKNTGFWSEGEDSGTDWHNHMSDPDSTDIIDTLGLASEPRKGLSRQKVRVLLNSPYLKIKELLKTGKDFNIEATEFAFVDTHKSFQNGGSPEDASNFEAPDSDPYDSADNKVHYGSIAINGEERKFLVLAHDGSYDTVYHSGSWKFNNSDTSGALGLEDSDIVEFGGRSYRFRGRDSGTVASQGKIVGLSRVMGRLGGRPPEQADSVTEINRFSNIGENPVKIKIQIWE